MQTDELGKVREAQRNECAEILQEAIYRGELGVIAAHKARRVIEAVRAGAVPSQIQQEK